MNNYNGNEEPVLVSPGNGVSQKRITNEKKKKMKKMWHSGGGKMQGFLVCTPKILWLLPCWSTDDDLKNFDEPFFSRKTKIEQDQTLLDLMTVKWSAAALKLKTKMHRRVKMSPMITVC